MIRNQCQKRLRISTSIVLTCLTVVVLEVGIHVKAFPFLRFLTVTSSIHHYHRHHYFHSDVGGRVHRHRSFSHGYFRSINTHECGHSHFIHSHSPSCRSKCLLGSVQQDNDNSSSDLSSKDGNGTRDYFATNQNGNPSIDTVETVAQTNSSGRWQANDFDNDRRLLELALARESAISNLQQLQRKYTLDYGFAQNRRPLVKDLLHVFIKIGALVVFFNSARGDNALDGDVVRFVHDSWKQPYLSTIHNIRIFVIRSTFLLVSLEHWIIDMILPLCLLLLVKFGVLGPEERTLDEYSTTYKPEKILNSKKLYFYSSLSNSNRRAREKDTGNFVLVLLENWCSAIFLSLAVRLYSLVASQRIMKMNVGSVGQSDIIPRLITRVGAAAALHQYPSLLFELWRGDRPRPISQSLAYMQIAVKTQFDWLSVGVASDLAMLLGNKCAKSRRVEFATLVASLMSIFAPFCHLVALGRIVRICKCSNVSLSDATTFPPAHNNTNDVGSFVKNHKYQVKWRYQLRWRTPQRLLETLRTWRNYFFTGHVPLLLEQDEWKKQPIIFDDFSTEGTLFREKNNITNHFKPNPDDLIAQSLSLIFRDRDAGIRNATQARLIKHQESYESKTLDDVLGVAVQQTFGIGLSYDYDHYDAPINDANISTHQLRARMAKSAIRRKRELDNAITNELESLRRINQNVITPLNRVIAESEVHSIEQGIQERHAHEVERMSNALRTLIATNANAPKGTERYESPILISQYVDLKAAPSQGEVAVTKEIGPDDLSVVENYIRRDFGDEAADAYRRDEIAARRKEREMLSKFRLRYGDNDDDNSS